MKKIGLLVAAGFMLAGLSSCVKDFECKCTTTFGNGDAPTTNTQTVKGTKKTSEVACDAFERTVGSGETEVKTECSI